MSSVQFGCMPVRFSAQSRSKWINPEWDLPKPQTRRQAISQAMTHPFTAWGFLGVILLTVFAAGFTSDIERAERKKRALTSLAVGFTSEIQRIENNQRALRSAEVSQSVTPSENPVSTN